MFGEELVIQRVTTQTEKAKWIECVQMHIAWQSDDWRATGGAWYVVMHAGDR
jgi:hypothetical protein